MLVVVAVLKMISTHVRVLLICLTFSSMYDQLHKSQKGQQMSLDSIHFMSTFTYLRYGRKAVLKMYVVHCQVNLLYTINKSNTSHAINTTPILKAIYIYIYYLI